MKHQQGLSLISLLIGLLISSIVLIGMMVIFRNTVQAVVPTAESSRSDGERASALLSAHMLLQDAGFGVEDAAYGTHLRMLNSNVFVPLEAHQGATAIGDTVVWLSNIGDSIQCNGLQADRSGGLWRVSCDIAMESITPTSRLILPSQSKGDTVNPIIITAMRTSCHPFSIEIPGKIMITLTVQNSTQRVIDSSTCVVNFVS